MKVKFLIAGFLCMATAYAEQPILAPPSDQDALTQRVIEIAEAKVLGELKAPATARFGEWKIKINEKRDKWILDGYVDSQNSFGAYLRSKVHCVLGTKDGGEHFRGICLPN